jgi:hypothetical protein
VLSASLLGLLSVLGSPCEAIGYGAYRCVSFNVGGAGGRCTNAPPINIRPDGSYSESSTTGRYSVSNGRIVFSQSSIRGPGELLDDNTIRFQYTYKGLAHTATYLCADCSNAPVPTAQARPSGTNAARVGVTLHIDFTQAISGATGFAIVPRELASQFEHHSALPAGAVSGLVVDVSSTKVRLVTNRYNQLAVNQHYVVFLSYAAETVAVAAFYLPTVPTDYEGRLRGGIYRNTLPPATASAPSSAPDLTPPRVVPPPSPGAGFAPPAPDAPSVHAYPAPPGTAYPSAAVPPAPPAPYPAGSPSYPAPPGAPQAGAEPGSSADSAQSLEGLARALKTLGDLFNSLGQPRQSSPMGAPPPSAYPAPGEQAPSAYPAAPPGPYETPAPPPTTSYPSAPAAVPGPKCNPNIPKYSQPACVE